MGAIMQCGCLGQSIEETKEGKHYQEAGYYEKALEKYEGALTLFIGTLKMYESAETAKYDSPYSLAVSLEDEIRLLFVLFGLVVEIRNCYIALNEAYKSLIFQKNLEEIVTTLSKYENKLNPKQFIAYKNLCKGIESLYQEIPLAASTSREALNDLSPVTDNSDDPMFRELCSKFDKCCSYRRCLLPSRGVSIIDTKESLIQRPVQISHVVAAIFFPPLGVYLTVGLGVHFWINLVLTFFTWIPGLIHALWLVFNHDRS